MVYLMPYMDKKGLGVANKLSDIGEREIIRKLEGLLDVGDDAAETLQLGCGVADRAR